MLPIEYPPLTLVPFSLALLAPFPYYQLAFALLMSLFSVLIYWLLLSYGPRGAALIFALYLFIGALATAEGRFDLIPAALTLLCLIAAERKHWTAAYVALAFGVLIKLYPLLLLPALFMAEQQVRARFRFPSKSLSLTSAPKEVIYTLLGATYWYRKNLLIFLGIVFSVTGAFALLNFQGATISQLQYFVQRPIQIEAIGSTLLWLANGFGFPLHVISMYGSLNSQSDLSGLVSLISIGIFGVGCLYIFSLQWRGKIDISQASIAMLLLFIATGKVFSPQYLIWLMPLLAYVGAFDIFWLISWGAISLLTTYTYMFLYSRISSPSIDIMQSAPSFFVIIGLRNALFLLVTLAYLFGWFGVRRRRLLPPMKTEQEHGQSLEQLPDRPPVYTSTL